jgi:hypothetical protein
MRMAEVSTQRDHMARHRFAAAATLFERSRGESMPLIPPAELEA